MKHPRTTRLIASLASVAAVIPVSISNAEDQSGEFQSPTHVIETIRLDASDTMPSLQVTTTASSKWYAASDFDGRPLVASAVLSSTSSLT
jgi:hypothetical protein